VDFVPFLTFGPLLSDSLVSSVQYLVGPLWRIRVADEFCAVGGVEYNICIFE